MANQPTESPLLNNRYKLLDTRGAGGMAVVYRAQDMMLERPVAIKLLRQDYSNNENFRDQFRREARAAANLSHPNIVTVHDFGYDAGRLFIVMEFVDGDDLKQLIRTKNRFSITEAILLMTQACSGIGYAHRAGIIHCDVKPHNMLVTQDRRLKMTDFGIARALSSVNPNEKSEEVWGSPQYFSPEQAAGLAPSPASDVYSLGVVLYEMLTGQLPFTASDAQELARMHRDVKPIPPRRLNREIPPELEQIILKVLSKEPAQRYRSADQLGRLLETFEGHNVALHPSKLQTEPVHGQPVRAQSVLSQTNSQAAQSSAPITTSPPVVQSTQPNPLELPAKHHQGPGIFSADVIILAIVALILLVGLVPFGLYILLHFGGI